MEMTGAEAILACLKAEQVPVVFGYPGGAVLGLYDAIYKTNFPPYSHRPRTGGHPRGGRVRPGHRKGGGVHCHQRPRGLQHGDGDCHRQHGFHSPR